MTLRTIHSFVALGADTPLGELSPDQVIQQALLRLTDEGLPVVQQSPLYRTPCFPAGAGPDYVNAAAAVSVPDGMTPDQVLAALHRVEAAFGRVRSLRWGQRTLDIDLLAMADLVLPDAAEQARWRSLSAADQARLAPDRLILPHPRLQDRAFVLVPLADIAPDWVHPALGLSVRQMLAALSQQDRADVRLFR